ncbi:putative glycosyltransferase domain containing protein [Candidatus Protochlamydia naegleriophila]|uniref:Putative glycosyltransferase domain containing protein n=1 Tax=Candidatus Protochlamydia naegleriophila TaxID=389348 RepID=A0A0U5ERM4_9BACT|nr:glycosyltransferase [Candidatus Protochlamydia naegleriophila]CUI16816.1 putative glycosyltransferase domain containing protein [Candidatus Protochlamydia naegleriophila]
MATILIYTSNVVGKAMAGPAIRSWEFAKSLSQKHKVVLVTPNQTAIEGEGFKIIAKRDSGLTQWIKYADVMITQGLTLSMAWQAKKYGIKIIIDAYDPIPLELLELFKRDPDKVRNERLNSSLNHLIFNFKMADAILCASEKQRDLWMGFLLGQKLITFSSYDQNNSLRQLIDVVPFGLPKEAPVKTGPGLREKYGFSAQDKILLWGGGIWNWFDPLSLIRAVASLSKHRSDIKLVFMGIKNPDPSVPEMAMSVEAIRLAKELGELDRSVFFNHGWVPYEERHNSLLDATIGVSTHFDHLETRYSFRTRMLDYIWTKLPILATAGDSFAELIDQHKLGKVVPYQDEQALAEAIETLIDNPEQMDKIKANLEAFSPQFQWDIVIKPVEEMIAHFAKQPAPSLHYKDLKTLSTFVSNQVAEKGLKQTAQLVLNKTLNNFTRRP